MEHLHKYDIVQTTKYGICQVCVRGFGNGKLLDFRSNIWISMNEMLIPATAKGYSQSALCPCTLLRSI